MKKRMLLILVCVTFSLFFLYNSAYAFEQKELEVGRFRMTVTEFTGMGQPPCWDCLGHYYYDKFGNAQIGYAGWWLGGKMGDSVVVTGCPHGGGNLTVNTIPVPDEEGRTIRLFMRYQPPEIEVDGMMLNRPFPYDEREEVNPDTIPGTADAMIESSVNTDIGVTLHQRVLGWSHSAYDDFVIYDWTFINTGNTDLDDEIELPNQTLDSLFFLRSAEWSWGSLWYNVGVSWERFNWHSCVGEYPEDSLRMAYSYSANTKDIDFDNLGDPDPEIGFLAQPKCIGEVYLHFPKSIDEPENDPAQPQMTSVYSSEEMWIKHDLPSRTQEDKEHTYKIMKEGFSTDFGWYNHGSGIPLMGSGVIQQTSQGYPTHHRQRMDEQDIKYGGSENIDWVERKQDMMDYAAAGPYTLGPGDTLRVVFAIVASSISPEKGYEVGTAWKNGSCAETWGGMDSTEIANELAKYYPAFTRYSDLSPTLNDQAKDLWILIGKDSLIAHAMAAQELAMNNYDVPVPPLPPSIKVTSSPNKILVEWVDNEYSSGDIAGYRIYRAKGTAGPWFDDESGLLIGSWSLVTECGPTTHLYEDTDVTRGDEYYYCVTAFNSSGLESGKLLNKTEGKGASLLRESGKKLSDIRVVPNPYNINAKDFLYAGAPRKINFFNLPPICTIRIYNESGDLIKTLEHTDGSGDEAWEDPTGSPTRKFMRSSSGQIPVSGIYIALIETPDGRSTNVKFFIVR